MALRERSNKRGSCRNRESSTMQINMLVMKIYLISAIPNGTKGIDNESKNDMVGLASPLSV